MKTKISIIGVVLILATQNLIAQWETNGNTITTTEWFGADANSDIPIRFEHRADDPASRFEWRTHDGTAVDERMRLTRNGWLGLGTNNPTRKFHIHEANDPTVSIRLTKTTNQFGLRIGLSGEGLGDPGHGFIRIDEDVPISISAHATESAVFTRESYSGPNNDLSGEVNRLLLPYNGAWPLDEPYSTLTMGYNWDAAEQDGLERSWMNVGTTCLFNADILYSGLIEHDNAVTDAVTAWGCQEGGANGPDNYRFLFITGTSGTGDAAEEEGRETMRITPLGNVGIGDFSSMPNGLDEQPTERLDVDGTARLRQMPNESPDVIITGIEEDEVGDYKLNYLEFSGNSNDVLTGDGAWIDGSGTLCDWNVVNGGNDVAMGYSGACVTEQMLVGADQQVGSDAKAFFTKDYGGTTLYAVSNTNSGLENAGFFEARNSINLNVGTRGHAINSDRDNIGVDGLGEDAAIRNYGVRGRAQDGRINFGVYGTSAEAEELNYGTYGLAQGSEEPAPLNNVGAYGQARGYASQVNFGGYFLACDAERNIGVYAETCDHGGVAVHAVGLVLQNQGTLSLSDETIKTGIEEIGSALDIIGQLNPIQYEYLTDQFPHLKLADDMSYGFSAQEVQQVLPDVVEEFYHPAKYDTSGEMISPSEDLLGIQYQEFIAILTAGIKEQQSQITEQAQTIDELQQSLNNQNDLIAQMMDQMDALANQVNDCCDGGIKYNAPDQGHGNLNENIKSGGNVLDQNTPNPFRSQTTISYSLETGGKVLLNVYDKAGKILSTLEESEQPAGTYRYEWNAAGLPAGLYHYALYVDGELLVKKAIKLAD